MSARKTFKEHRADLLEHLRGAGWKVETKSSRAPWAPLKVPRATSPDGSVVLSFRTQAVYQGEHSLVSDMREVDGPALERISSAQIAALRRSADERSRYRY